MTDADYNMSLAQTRNMSLVQDRAIWLSEFESICAKSASPTEVTRQLAMLGIDDPEAPLAVPSWEDAADPVFNKRVHKVLVKHNFLLRVRKVLLADLKTDCSWTVQIKSEASPAQPDWDATMNDCHLYGKLALKSWSQSVLDNFLKVKPTESWCQSTTT